MGIIRRFIQCDVFTSIPTRGNALAVVVDGEGLTDAQMRAFAAWTNLAETTFLMPPENPAADYKVRIFTPAREMPFAGHPTLGSCAAWLRCGGVPKTDGVITQECAVGLVDIVTDGAAPAFVAPPTSIIELPQIRVDELAAKLKLNTDSIIRTAILDNGPVWQVFELATAADVLAADASAVKWAIDKPVGLIGPHPAEHECDHEVRMLAPSSGMSEDPITGSLNSALAHWMLSLGKLDAPVIVAQGTSIDRVGRVYISPDGATPGRVLIGGHSHVLIEGTVLL